MGWRRRLTEDVLGWVGRPRGGTRRAPEDPGSIFVLRNNDIGDLLVITPLLEALKRRFPRARLAVGVGDWNIDVLRGNTWVDRVLPVNGPWHNTKVCRAPWYSLRGLFASLRYIALSREARALRRERFDIGIDVLGSVEGALLLLRAGVRWRIGVRGYAGGHSAMHACVEFDGGRYVGRAALGFARLLGLSEEEWPEERPQIFLSAREEEVARELWARDASAGSGRLVVGFGAGESGKRWPPDRVRELLRLASASGRWEILLVGGGGDRVEGESLAADLPGVRNLAGHLGLRETFALVSLSDAVVTNSSMLMHVAAAFERPAAVVLGERFPSASAHARLWSCNPRAVVLGKEPGGRGIATATEVTRWMEMIRGEDV